MEEVEKEMKALDNQANGTREGMVEEARCRSGRLGERGPSSPRWSDTPLGPEMGTKGEGESDWLAQEGGAG